MPTTRRRLIAAGGLLLGGLSVVGFTGSGFTGVTQAPRSVGEGRFDGWSYRVAQDPDGDDTYQMVVQHAQATEADLRAFVSTNRLLAQRLGEGGVAELDVSISFRRPVPVDEFRRWVPTTPMQVKAFQARVRGPNGERWTLGGGSSPGQVVDDARLQSALQRMSAQGARGLEGVVIAEGSVRTADYAQLAADPLVFLADVTKSAARDHVRRTTPSLASKSIHVIAPPSYWAMETIGLEKFR